MADPSGSDPGDRAAAQERGAQRVRLPRALGAVVTALDRALALFWNQPLLYLALVGLAVYAGVWGFTSFYGSQYGRVPWYLWPFVPDSPLATTSWIAASLLVKLGWDKLRGTPGAFVALFVNWSAMMNIKVGLWTVFVLFYYYDHFFGAGDPLQWVLVVAHLGMVVFAVMLLRKMRALPLSGYVLILGLGFLWDFMDYYFVALAMPGSGVTIFPNGVPTAEGPIQNVVAPVTMALTLFSTLALALGIWLRGPPVER